MNAKDAIAPSWYETFCKYRDRLYEEQMVPLNTRLFTLEKIEAFPFTLFLPEYDDRVFWQTTRNALVETIILGIHRIGYDQGSRRGDQKLLTLKFLKDKVSQNLRDDDAETYFWKRCGEADFEIRRKAFNGKISTIRNQYLCHLYSEPEQVEPITLGELQELREILYDLLQVLFFDTFPVLTLWAYGPTNRPTDIDKILDGVARDSYRLNWPENAQYEHDRQWFNDWLSGLSPTDLAYYNEYRRKFDLPEMYPKDNST